MARLWLRRIVCSEIFHTRHQVTDMNNLILGDMDRLERKKLDNQSRELFTKVRHRRISEPGKFLSVEMFHIEKREKKASSGLKEMTTEEHQSLVEVNDNAPKIVIWQAPRVPNWRLPLDGSMDRSQYVMDWFMDECLSKETKANERVSRWISEFGHRREGTTPSNLQLDIATYTRLVGVTP
jgi:hypothetical protein